MNPTAAQRVSVTTADGLGLVARQIGPESADLTVILLHGLLGDGHSWRHQTTHLRSRYPDIRVIAYDQRGHGRSGRGCTLTNTIGQLARDLDAVNTRTAKPILRLAGRLHRVRRRRLVAACQRGIRGTRRGGIGAAAVRNFVG
jgi:pimeloyl-ACP methyl ester carboxylesterase